MNVLETVQIGKTPIEFRRGGNGATGVYYEGKKIESLSALLQLVPELKTSSNALQAANIINFLLQGMAFKVIEDPETFKEKYLGLLKKEEKVADNQHFRTSAYGLYDPHSIAFPEWQDGVMVFYAVSTATGVPYRVTFKAPEGFWDSECRYELLPAQN